jgi:HK97 family phage major capsid protein
MFMTELERARELKAAAEQIRDGVIDKMDRFQIRLDQLEGMITRPGRHESVSSSAPAGFKTATDKIFENRAGIELLDRTKRVSFPIGSFFPTFSEKALIDSAALGFATPGVLSADRINPIVQLPQRRLTLRDLLRSRPTSNAQVDFIRSSAFTNRASPQTEGVSKAESEMAFAIASARIRTIAHHVTLTRQAVDDLVELRRFVDDQLVYGLRLVEEYEFISGAGTGEPMHGFMTQATAYAGTYNVAGDTKLDKLRHAILELNLVDEEPTGFILHPKDYHDIQLIKTEDGGANKGTYIAADPMGGAISVPTIWGLPTVVTRAMPAGNFVCADFRQGLIADRMDATVDASMEHASNFIENKITLLGEFRAALCVLRTSAFLRGTY